MARDKLTGMPVADHIGTLADVRAARRMLSVKFEPPLAFYVAWAAVFALCCGSKSLLLALVGVAALTAATAAATWWQSRRARFIRPRRIRLFSRRVLVLASLCSLFSLVVVLAIIGGLIAAILHRWTWGAVIMHRATLIAYVVPFVVFIVPVMAAIALPWRIDPYGLDAHPLRKAPDQPAVLNPVIEPRQRIMVCAMLASLECIDAGFLAKMLRSSDEELRQQVGELVAAQYISVYPNGRRWWVSLTAAGRAAYRRHLRALQRAGRVPGRQATVPASGSASR
jgi:Winged helix DNA-binding domain